jgi:hypothetical protein
MIKFIERLLWGMQLGSQIAPSRWGLCARCDESTPWISTASSRPLCTRCSADDTLDADA